MASTNPLNPESEDFQVRPNFYLGQHDSDRTEILTDSLYSRVLNAGVNIQNLLKRSHKKVQS
jgi:protein arginine N-methyltransferase 5